MNAPLELVAVACRRGERTLFTDLSLALHAGAWLHVQGANGAGKTSLLRLMCGLATPTQGELRWRGAPIAAARERFHAELSYLGHSAALKADLSALENLQAAAHLAGIAWDPAAARSALAKAGLAGREHLPARSLSQGQRQRAALARLALRQDAGLWVLDEPFNALDRAASDWLAGLVAAQLDRGGIVVLTSHQPLAFPGRAAPRALAL